MPVAVGAQTNTPGYSFWQRLRLDNNWISFWFMVPAGAFLILFLAYPLGLGVWMSFTDARIGRDGVFIGLENSRRGRRPTATGNFQIR